MSFCIILSIVVSLVLFDLQLPSSASLTISLFGVASVQLLVAVSARQVVDASLRELGNVSSEVLDQNLARRFGLHRVVWLLGCLLMLFCFEWPQSIAALVSSRFVARLILLVPVLFPVVAGWVQFFSLESKLDTGVREDGLWSFLLRRFRTDVSVPLLAILVVATWQDVVEPFSASLGSVLEVAVRAIPLVVLAFCMPSIVRRTWQTEPLGQGELRAALEHRCQGLGIAIREILVWNTGGQQRNAAVAGWLPPWQYVLLSDRLLLDLPTQQIEAVFLHEMAHSRKQHQVKLMFVAVMLFGVLLALCSLALLPSIVSRLYLVPAAIFGLLAMYFFGRLARLFEFEADLWAAKQLGGEQDLLQAISAIYVGDTGSATWLHPSLEQRSRLLHKEEVVAQRWVRTRVMATISWLLGSLGIVLSIYGVALLG